MEFGNITKAATFKSYLHLSYNNTQLLFLPTLLFNIFMRQTLTDAFWWLHKNMNCAFLLKDMKVLLYICFYNISLNVLRPTRSPHIGKIRVNIGPKTNYFCYFICSCLNRIEVFHNFLHWYVANQETNKTVPTISFFSKFFLIFFFIFILNMLSKLVELLK